MSDDIEVARGALIGRLIEALRLDKGLARASRTVLAEAPIDELERRVARAIHIRQQLTDYESVSRELDDARIVEFEEWVLSNSVVNPHDIKRLLTVLKFRDGPIQDILDRISELHERMKTGVLKGNGAVYEYYPISDQIIGTCLDLVSDRIDTDEKIALTDLAVTCLITINALGQWSGTKAFNDIIYNCFQACKAVDSLQGFGRNIDRFNSSALSELNTIGPQLLSYIESEEFSAGLANLEDPSSRIDWFTNPADVLQFWGYCSNREAVYKIYKLCFDLYDNALAIAEDRGVKVPLVVLRYSEARLRFSRIILEERHHDNLDAVWREVRNGTILLQRLCNSDGDLHKYLTSDLPPRLKLIEFALVTLEMHPQDNVIKASVVESILALADEEGSSLTTRKPWLWLYRIYAEICETPEEGLDRLEDFKRTAKSAIAKSRANFLIKRLAELDTGRNETTVFADLTWLENLRRKPRSVYCFKDALHGYLESGYGPNRPLDLSKFARVPSDGYADVFLLLVKYDKSAQKKLTEVVSDKTQGDFLKDSGLLELFKGDLNVFQRVSLEELSKFFFDRGQKYFFDWDINSCAELLGHGLDRCDDSYWYLRLCDCYRYLKNRELERTTLQTAITKFPGDSRIALRAALAQIEKRQFSEAANVIAAFVDRTGTELSSHHPAVLGVYAYAMSRSNQPTGAEKLYRHLVSTRPRDWRAMQGLGNLLYRSGPEKFPEALGLWTSAIMIRGRTEELWEDKIIRDCSLNIGQTVKELRRQGSAGEDQVANYLGQIGDQLPTWKLANVMNAFSICGGLQGQALILSEPVIRRSDPRLKRLYAQFCMSMLIEDIVRGRDVPYVTDVIQFCMSHDALGYLFGGSRSAYYRNLLRISSTPIIAKKIETRLARSTPSGYTEELYKISHMLTQGGRDKDHYRKVNDIAGVFYKDDVANIAHNLVHFILYTSQQLSCTMDRKIILMSPSSTRTFAPKVEFSNVGNMHNRYYNCDPDKLLALLQTYHSNNSWCDTEGSSWQLAGNISGHMRTSLASSNIKIHVFDESNFSASISASVPLYQ